MNIQKQTTKLIYIFVIIVELFTGCTSGAGRRANLTVNSDLSIHWTDSGKTKRAKQELKRMKEQLHQIETSYQNKEITKAEYLQLKINIENAYLERNTLRNNDKK
jgi:hypothetical protein